jgi:hypothetical protein
MDELTDLWMFNLYESDQIADAPGRCHIERQGLLIAGKRLDHAE